MNEKYLLRMNGISKRFSGVRALDKVDLSVLEGEVHCLIGANGAGKSTLMKVLSGVHTQDEGDIYFDGNLLETSDTLKRRKAGISVIYQERSLVDELDVAENIFMNDKPKTAIGTIDWKTMYRKAVDLVKYLNIDLDVKTKVSQLSTGKKQLVELMKAIAGESKLIIMDEPSATLSTREFETLITVIKDLKNKGMTIIYISHRLEELFIVGDNVTVLLDGTLVGCFPTKSLDKDTLVGKMTGTTISKVEHIDEVHKVSDLKVLELKNINSKHVKNINLDLHKGEIFGLYGLVGSGRTEILRIIYGLDSYEKGEIYYNSIKKKISSSTEAIRNKIGLIPENRKTQGLVLGLPIWENMSMVSLDKHKKKGILNYKSIKYACEEYKTSLNIKMPSIKTITKNLSGGNQQKVVIAKWLMKDSEILMIDEPTQGIDVMAKKEIYKIMRNLADEGKSLIVVSSELEELLTVCDNISVMYEGEIVKRFSKINFNQDLILRASVSGR